ncbi:hypothetical protein SAMN05444164_6291 [Bradyrhizobium erythrophlei]|uniref:Uncharacterized protein n=2 Tax=Bradyrhizobium erythrophlei TaxID=1437360 RepID=A0A1H5ELU2_9BRAD|nr:hypothetical protein SAMN05444164_6291 [Bradyrhizobium erythrophlei]
MPEFNYDAFISYRRSDGIAVARWLRRALVGFRLPAALRDVYGRKLRVYLDLAYERGSSDFYQQSIRPALLSSRYLIVVATPNAMRRPGGVEDWIEREIRDFATGPGAGNVIVARGAGDFDGPLPGGLKETFPNIEIVDLRGAGRFWFLSFSRVVRLSAEKLKIVAPLFNIPPDEMPRLRQEEEKRQQTQLGAVAGATLGTLLAVGSLSVVALINQHKAIRANDDSMFAASSMVEEAVNLSAGDASASRTRRLIIGRGCDLLDKADQGTTNDPPINGVVTCRLERGARREALHEDKEARKEFSDAIERAALSHQSRARVDAALALLQARQAYAEYLMRQKDTDGASHAYADLLEDARRLGKEHDGRAQIVRFEAEARGQTGDLHAAANRHQEAADSYSAGADALKRLLDARRSDGRTEDDQVIAWRVRLFRLAGQQYVTLDRPDPAAEQFKLAVGAGASDDGKPADASVAYEVAIAQAYTLLIERKRGNAAAAADAKQGALNSVDAIAASDAGAGLKRLAADLKRWIEQQGN